MIKNTDNMLTVRPSEGVQRGHFLLRLEHYVVIIFITILTI